MEFPLLLSWQHISGPSRFNSLPNFLVNSLGHENFKEKKQITCWIVSTITPSSKGMVTVPSLSSLGTPGKGRGHPCLGPAPGKGCKAGLGDWKGPHHHPLSMASGKWSTGKTELLLRRKRSNSSVWLRGSRTVYLAAQIYSTSFILCTDSFHWLPSIYQL